MVEWTKPDRLRYGILVALAGIPIYDVLPENVWGRTAKFAFILVFLGPLIGWPATTREVLAWLGVAAVVNVIWPYVVPASASLYVTLGSLGVLAIFLVIYRLMPMRHKPS